MSKIEKAIKDLKDYIQLWEDEQADEDLTVIIYKNTIESFKIAKQALEKQINNPLTLDKVRELKSGDIVWLKDEDGLRAIEYSHIHNSKYGETVYYFMFDVEGIEGHDLVYLNESFFIYRNKPDHIADVSKKEEI